MSGTFLIPNLKKPNLLTNISQQHAYAGLHLSVLIWEHPRDIRTSSNEPQHMLALQVTHRNTPILIILIPSVSTETVVSVQGVNGSCGGYRKVRESLLHLW